MKETLNSNIEKKEQEQKFKFADLAPDIWQTLGEKELTIWKGAGIKKSETVLEHTIAIRDIAKSLNNFSSQEKSDLLDMLEVHGWPKAKNGDDPYIFLRNKDDEESFKIKARIFEKDRVAMVSICENLGEKGKEIMDLWLRFETSRDEVASFARQLDKYQDCVKALDYEKNQRVLYLYKYFIQDIEKDITHPVLLEKVEQLNKEYELVQEANNKEDERIYENIFNSLKKRANVILENTDLDIDTVKYEEINSFFYSVFSYRSLFKTISSKTKTQSNIELIELERSIFDKFYPVFNKSVSEEKPLSENCLRLLSDLSDSPDIELSHRSGSYLLKNLELISKSKVNGGDVLPIAISMSSLLDIKHFLSEEEVNSLFFKLIKDKVINFSQISLIIAQLFILEGKSKDFAKQYITSFLNKHGLSSEDIIKAWESNAQVKQDEKLDKKYRNDKENADKQTVTLILKNFTRIQNLEMHQKGAAKFLHENYGISNFGRFSVQTWLDQYRDKDKVGPSGLVVSATHDWNSSSYSQQAFDSYEKLRKQVSPSHALRVIEAASLPDLAKLLLRLKKKHEQKPDFVIWSGHGNENQFFLGSTREKKKNFLDKIDIIAESKGKEERRISKYLEMFSADTLMILDSCSGDGKKVLPRVMASAMGNKFIYPKGTTSVRDFGVKRDEKGKLSFNVKYHSGIETGISNGK